MENIKLSNHFTLAEFCNLGKYPDNIPTVQQIANMAYGCRQLLEPARKAIGCPIIVNSGFRNPRVNALVGGVRNSQHQYGQAADLCIDGDMQKGKRWFEWIKIHCEFDQLIWEHNAKGSYWVHVSYRADGKNRKKVIDKLIKK